LQYQNLIAMAEKDNSKINIRYPERHNNPGQFRKGRNTAQPRIPREDGEDKTENGNEKNIEEDIPGADGTEKS
jgi:hypothetical protein